VDTQIFQPASEPIADLRKSLNLPTDKHILLYVGRLAPEKNVQTLFAAFRRLKPKANCHLVVVGDGTQRGSVEKLMRRTGAVTWIPYCSDPNELARIYRAADLFVHPGIQETFGLVTLESQACGTPIVGIRGSYMDRIIFSDQFAWASENSPQSLAQAIQAKLSLDLRALGQSASEAVRQNYSWNRVFDRIFHVYQRVIDNYLD
jgi:alpha-1,6-mannosyltransferase